MLPHPKQITNEVTLFLWVDGLKRSNATRKEKKICGRSMLSRDMWRQNKKGKIRKNKTSHLITSNHLNLRPSVYEGKQTKSKGVMQALPLRASEGWAARSWAAGVCIASNFGSVQFLKPFSTETAFSPADLHNPEPRRPFKHLNFFLAKKFESPRSAKCETKIMEIMLCLSTIACWSGTVYYQATHLWR